MDAIGKSYILFWLACLPLNSLAGNSRHFVTESCGHVIGPDYGAYLEFDREATMVKNVVSVPYHLKGKEFECIIVVRGMPSTGEKRYMAIHMRQFHLMDQVVVRPENEVAKCGKAYMIVYNGMDRTAKEKYVFCGADAVVQNLEWTGEYITFYFYMDFRNPDFSTPDPLVSLAPQVTTGIPPITTPDPFPYPTAYFKMDISSFDYGCNETVENIVLKCNDSRRCLDESLKCDFWFSRNCPSEKYPKDATDTSRQPPANCFTEEDEKPTTTTTTTTIPPPPFKPNLTPLYAAIGGVLGVAMLLWCCWKPAYLPWRLGRCRNYPCWVKCGNLCPCLKCRACYPGPSAMSPTGAAAWRAAKLQRGSLISQDMSDLSPLGPGPYSISGYPDSQYGEHNLRLSGPYGGYPYQNGAKVPLSDKIPDGSAKIKRKGLASQICPCMSDSTVDEGTPRKSIKSGQVAPYPNGRGSIPNGGPLTEKSFERSVGPFDRYPRHARHVGNVPSNPQADLDAVSLANNWMRMVSGDGSHLREQR